MESCGLQNVLRELGRVNYPDGQIVRAELEGGRAVIIFGDWQQVSWRLEFGGVVLFRASEFSGDITSVLVAAESSAIEEAVSTIERDGGRREGYPGLLCADFVADMPVVTIVFQSLRISCPDVA